MDAYLRTHEVEISWADQRVLVVEVDHDLDVNGLTATRAATNAGVASCAFGAGVHPPTTAPPHPFAKGDASASSEPGWRVATARGAHLL